MGVEPEFEHLAFSEEAFCSLAATTELGGDDPAEYLGRAVEFCNERLAGTLNATMLVDHATQRTLARELDAACDDLRYGTVGINVWAAAGFVLGVTPWGGYPGATTADVQSGIGFVHNARLLDRPEKTVIRGPFRPRPKPPWFVTHRNTFEALRRAATFEASPGVGRLALLAAASIRS
jgi:aldehyde dehydrogenase (NAD(P)+)